MQQRGNGDVVRQVGDQSSRLVGKLTTGQVQDVAVEHRQPVDLAVGVLRDSDRQLAGQHGIDLHRGHARSAIEQSQGQRSQAWADLQNVVMPVDTGRRNYPTNSVGVVDEILAERFARPEINLFRQVSYLGPPEQSNCQRAPILPLHVGHAPHP